MKTLATTALFLLLIACKPLDMSNVEGVNFYAYAEDSLLYKQGEPFPLLPEDASKNNYQYLNFQLQFKGRYLQFSYDKINDSIRTTETKTFKGRWRKNGWRYRFYHAFIPLFPILFIDEYHKIYLKPKGNKTLDVLEKKREWALALPFGGRFDSYEDHLYFKSNENIYLPIVFYENNKYGLKKGNTILSPAQYNKISLFNEDVSIVQKDSLYGLINSKGKELTPIIYNIIQYQKNFRIPSFFLVEKEKLWGILSLQGQSIIPTEFQFLQYEWMHTPDFFLVQKNNLWGFINIEGKEILPLQYDHIYETSYGYTLVKGNKLGFISFSPEEKNDRFIPAKYTSIEKNTLWNDYVLVWDENTPLFVDKEGNEYKAEVREVRKIDNFFGYPSRDNEVNINNKYYLPILESKQPPKKE